jgi:hypothetical protein
MPSSPPLPHRSLAHRGTNFPPRAVATTFFFARPIASQTPAPPAFQPPCPFSSAPPLRRSARARRGSHSPSSEARPLPASLIARSSTGRQLRCRAAQSRALLRGSFAHKAKARGRGQSCLPLDTALAACCSPNDPLATSDGAEPPRAQAKCDSTQPASDGCESPRRCFRCAFSTNFSHSGLALPE